MKRLGLGILLLVLVKASLAGVGASAPAAAGELDRLNLPPEFRQRMADRTTIDQYQAAMMDFEEKLRPVPQSQSLQRVGERTRTVRVRMDTTPPGVAALREKLIETGIQNRAFRAPILQHQTEPWPREAGGVAAEFVRDHLAADGLLLTVANVIERLGIKDSQNETNLTERLKEAGVPGDWLARFKAPEGTSSNAVRFIGGLVGTGKKGGELKRELARVRFEFEPVNPAFRMDAELGEVPVAMYRMQIGGGYAGGVIPGDVIDVASQMVAASGEARFLMSLPRDRLEMLQWMALRIWPLKRSGQVVFLPVPHDVKSWAQDNGKPGLLRVGADSGKAAVLVPRCASMDEGLTTLMPGESFLMDGVNGAGIEVLQSPLLFQGGNLAAIEVHGKRLLLIGEGEIYRNEALGLSREQVMEAFRREFGVEEAVLFPVGSFHLDFDVTFRKQGTNLLAFINDPKSAAEALVVRGFEALEKGGMLKSEAFVRLRELAKAGEFNKLSGALRNEISKWLTEKGTLRKEITRAFSAGPADSGSGNFSLWLAALDVLESLEPNWVAGPDPRRKGYLSALRNVLKSISRQRTVLESLGCKIRVVPGFPDFLVNINYLNGVQDLPAYYMPAFGGLYSGLDDTARGIFESALGTGVRVVPILCGEVQRNHGALHCLISTFQTAP